MEEKEVDGYRLYRFFYLAGKLLYKALFYLFFGKFQLHEKS